MRLKHLILSVLLASVTALCFLSCEKKQEYVHPVFGTLVQQPTSAKAGQNVTLTFQQQQQGNGIAGTNYTWTIRQLRLNEETGERKDTIFSVHTNYDGYGKANPSLTFQLPTNTPAGSYSVEIYAEFSCYIGQVLFDEARATGRLKVE